jgi:hypothetical protein
MRECGRRKTLVNRLFLACWGVLMAVLACDRFSFGRRKRMSRLTNKEAPTRRRTLIAALFGAGATLALVFGLGLLAATGSAASQTAPKNTSPPTISGQPNVGQILTADPGTWDGTAPIKFAYQWRRCDDTGGACADIDGATAKTYTLKPIDAGNTLRVRVTASNKDGSSSATSVPTAVIRSNPVTGCPPGPGPVMVTQVTAPARLVIDHLQYTPAIVHRSTRQITGRFHVSDSCGQTVQGALVYATAVPYHQLNNAPEQATDATGWATINFQTLSGFPADPHQQLMAFFVRARKPGEDPLGGISIRRLVSVPVDLRS